MNIERTQPLEELQAGVDFSKCQMDEIIKAYEKGRDVEFESFSPYLADYNTKTGEIWEDKLTKTDTIGIAIAKMLKNEFPNAQMVSLYDEYNSEMPYATDVRGRPKPGPQIEFPETVKLNFRNSIEQLLRNKGVIEGKEKGNYLFVSESSKIKDAEELVKRLEDVYKITRDGQAIYFVNPEAENPDYRKIPLRTKNGRWLCEALDASSYLDPKNLEITHLVILPNVFKEEQDKVWEILRVLGIKPTNYHNIFFNENLPPDEVKNTIEEKIKNTERKSASIGIQATA